LPKLVVSDKGEAKDKLEVKGLKLADLQGKTLMIHAGGDNYSESQFNRLEQIIVQGAHGWPFDVTSRIITARL
jgi:Cu/Zn superoxide dismutase